MSAEPMVELVWTGPKGPMTIYQSSIIGIEVVTYMTSKQLVSKGICKIIELLDEAMR